MATALLGDGSLQVMLQNVVYALPPYVVTLFTDGAAPTIQQSTDAAFTANVAVTLSGGQATLAGGFVRETNLATMNVYLKRTR
jgi:hypothetical protein